MATRLKGGLVASLGNIVQSSLVAASKMKNANFAAKEAEFQRALAEGTMSYAAQIAYRQQMINEEESSGNPDKELISKLTESINSTKKLDRFARYREKYQKSFAELQSGRQGAEAHLEGLKQVLQTTNDPELRQEILGNITTAENELRSYNNTVLENKIKKAQYDGSSAVLDSTIKDVQDKRALALLNGNKEEASALDVTLSVLQQQSNKVKVEDKLNDLEVRNFSKTLSPMSKIEALNTEIRNADTLTPITMDGKKYNSMAEYWTQKRDGYLAGQGSGMFSNFFNEMASDYKDKLETSIARDGHVTAPVLDAIKGDFTELKARPEFQPFINKLDNLTATTLASATTDAANKIIATAMFNGDFKGANAALQSYASNYGVNLDAARMQLGEALTNAISRAANATGKSETQIEAEMGLQNTLKGDEFSVISPEADRKAGTPKANPYDAAMSANLDAAQKRIDAGTASEVDKKNVAQATKNGWTPSSAPASGATTPTATPTSPASPLPVAPVTPAPTSPTVTPAATPAPAPAPVKPVAPVTPAPAAQKPSSTVPPAQGQPNSPFPPTPTFQTTGTPTAPSPAPAAPAAPAAPVAAAPTPVKSTYAGSSLTDYLAANKQANSYADRVKLAKQNGINDYSGTADQNTALLKKLRGA